jgi:hypothetical protein
MPLTDKRRADARRRAWGRGPMILRFEPLEGRALLSTTTTPLPDLVGASFTTPQTLNWGDSFDAVGLVSNQGNATATNAFQVDIYASSTPGYGPGSQILGVATIPAGLKAGTQAPFDQKVSLPTNPLGTSGAVYIGMIIDPANAVSESLKSNNANIGEGYDESVVNISAGPTALLVGTSLVSSTADTSWGGALQITQQIANIGNGNAPATRARIVLTPSGATPGGASDVTIANVSVPAIAAGQSTTVIQTFNLPSIPPPTVASSTNFTLSVVQDADYLTNQLYPHVATQGSGLDEAPIAISTPGYTGTLTSALPALAVTTVQTDSANVKWGQNFQVAAEIQNSGTVDSGAFRVRYLLVGDNESISSAIFLGDATVANVPAGNGEDFIQTLRLPTHLPAGQTLGASIARIAVIVDPENTMYQRSTAGDIGFSNRINLQVVKVDGTTTPATTTTTTATTTTTPTTSTRNTAVAKTTAQKVAAARAARAAAAAALASTRKAKPVNHSVSTILKHDLKVFPQRVSDFFKKHL